MTEQEQALKTLATLNPGEAIALLAKAHNAHLYEAEKGKKHPLSDFTIPDNEWAQLRDHVIDGGGVIEDSDLHTEILNSILQNDQKVFWPALIHVLKSYLKIKGRIQPLAGGGVFMSGAQHSGTLEIDPKETK